MTTVMDVIVVGCGAAGLAAMRKLHEAGFKVLGLEAKDRIGGRIHSVDFGACVTDLGAAWCEGINNNVVYDMASSLDLVEKQGPCHQWFIVSNGEQLPTEVGSEVVEGFSRAIEKADKSGDKSLADCFKNVTESCPSLKNQPNLAKSFTEWYGRCKQIGGQRDPTLGKSLKGLEDCKVDNSVMCNWKGRGYKTILDLLLNKYPDPAKEIPLQIMLNKEVQSIKWRPSLPGHDSGNPLVQVKCTDGSLYTAKSIIVTMSVAVLRERHSQLFNPPLPIEKVNCIKTIQLCVLGKVYIEFTKPWWPKTPASFAILWRDEDKLKFSDDDKWITEIWGLDTVHHQPNVLLAWLYGDAVESMEKTSEENVLKGVNKLLDLIFKKQFEITPVMNIKRSTWATDPLTRGAYSFRTVAAEKIGANAVVLSEPLYHNDNFPVVCFAGEATSHQNFTAVQGAVESGFREADRLIKHLRK